MALLIYFNYATNQTERIDTAQLTDAKAMQLIPQNKVSQATYVYARRMNCGIQEAISRALTEGRDDRR